MVGSIKDSENTTANVFSLIFADFYCSYGDISVNTLQFILVPSASFRYKRKAKKIALGTRLTIIMTITRWKYAHY